MTGIEILLVVLIAGYLAESPDPLSLAVTRGLKGAVVGGVKHQLKPAVKNPVTGKKERAASETGEWDALWQACKAGWNDGIARAKQARLEGRDAWTFTSRLAGRAAGGADNIRIGFRAARARWRTARTKFRGWAESRRGDDNPVVTGEVVDQPGEEPEPYAPDPPVPPKPIVTVPASPSGNQSGASTTQPTMKDLFMTMQTEITSVDQLEALINKLHPLAIDALEVLQQLKKIMAELPDNFTAAQFSTPGLTAAVSAIGDAASSIQISTDVPDIIAGALPHIAAAKGVGEVAATVGAEGDVKAFQPS